MGGSGKYYLVTILFLFYTFSIDSVNADFCYDEDGDFEMSCPDSFSLTETYCCGSPGFQYCCDYDDYELYNDVADTISTAIIVTIVISIIIVVAIVIGIIACCVCGCVCCAQATNTRPVTRTFVTTQPVQQSQVVVQQAYPPQQQAYPPPQGGYPPQQAAYPPAGGAYPPPAYVPPAAEGEKPPSYPI